jgi:hypothetical protein
MRVVAGLALVAAIAAGCTGTFDGDGGLASSAGDASSEASSAADGSFRGGSDASAQSNDGSVASTDAPPTGAALDGGLACQTSVDSYGYTRCTCAEGVTALGDAGVASCTGYACCVSYGGDSGLAAGFGDPTLSSGLCGCFQSADVAALLGADVSCAEFANDGVGSLVAACP